MNKKTTKRAQAVSRVHQMIEALEEHISDAAREVTPGEAVANDVWLDTLMRFQAALYAADLPSKDGSLRIDLDLADDKAVR
jgi:hypothetical protein